MLVLLVSAAGGLPLYSIFPLSVVVYLFFHCMRFEHTGLVYYLKEFKFGKGKDWCKPHVLLLYHPTKDCNISFLLKTQIYLITLNSISINF